MLNLVKKDLEQKQASISLLNSKKYDKPNEDDPDDSSKSLSLHEFAAKFLSLLSHNSFAQNTSLPSNEKIVYSRANTSTNAHYTHKMKSSSRFKNYNSNKNINDTQSKLRFWSISSPAMLLLSSATSKPPLVTSTSSSLAINNHHLSYKNNELYSFFVSMFTASIFLLFIMWRWFRMKSDLRKALREQLEINRNGGGLGGSGCSSRRATPFSSSSHHHHHHHHHRSHNHHFFHHNHQHYHNHYRLLNSTKRQQLQQQANSIIAQLANGEHR